MNGVFSPLASAYRTILQTDGGLRIFQEFGLHAGERYVSPFRPDATKKNFTVFRSSKGDICFKDFVSGDGGTFTALLYQFGYTNFEAQIRFAASVYGIPLKEQGTRSKEQEARNNDHRRIRRNHQPNNNQKPTTKSYRVTALELGDFTPLELQRLQELSAGLITPELLAKYGIRALRSYTDEGVSAKGFAYGGRHEARFTLVVPSANDNYYAYCYFQSDTHSPFPNHAKNFHLKLGEYTDDVKFTLGLTELRSDESAYLVEGIKDCLILLARGYNAFTLGGVQHRLHPSVVKRLQENRNTLTIVFDTDFAGINAAKRLAASLHPHPTLAHAKREERASETNPRFTLWKGTDEARIRPLEKGGTGDFPPATAIIRLPRLERQETQDQPKPLKNDIADYVADYGFDDLLEQALLCPAPLRASTLTKGTITIPAWKLTIQDKLGNDPAALKTLQELLRNTSRLVLRAPTGCGKTHTLLRTIAPQHHAETGGMTVLAVPTLALAEQIKQEYADLKPIVITGNENDMHRYYRQFDDGAKPLDTYIIIVVYDSVRRVMDVLMEDTTLFCIDEMHTLVHDYSYRSYAMRSMNNALRHAANVLCLSATPELLFHEAPFNFTYCDIEVQAQRPLSTSFHDYDKRDEAVLALMLQNLATMTDSDRIMLRVQSKSLLRRMQTLLVRHGVPENDIALLTNDTTAKSDEYRFLVQTRMFSRKILLCTSIFDTGINILNTGRIHIIMPDEKNEDTIVQVANRFRKAEIIHVHLLYSERVSKERKRAFAEQYHFFHTLFSAQMLADTMNTEPGRSDTAVGISRKSASRLFDTMLHFDGKHHHHRWQQDELAVMHACAAMRIQSTSPDDLQNALRRYGFRHNETSTPEPITHTLSPHTLQAIETTAQEQRHELRQNDETVLRLLAEKLRYFLAALNSVSRSRSLKNALPSICPEALFSCTKNHEETAAILTEHAELLRQARTETLVRYYSEARTLGFDHKEALHLVSMNRDPRKWQSFTERLAMKQRETAHQLGLTDHVLSQHDREKLQREEELRTMIRNSAETGCFFTGSDGKERQIPSSIRSKRELAERVNAYKTQLFRLTQQKAGEIVEAMFHLQYVRERTRKDDTVRLSGYYAFEQENNILRRKTLAEYLTGYGVDGEGYEAAFVLRTREAAARYADAVQRLERQKDEYAAFADVA